MKKKIKQIFLDKNNYIYVVDDRDILYLYDDDHYDHYDDDRFYPFLDDMIDIKNCFLIYNLFYIHHGKTISIFDENLSKVYLSSDTWITNEIDKVCYHENNNIIVTLENGQVYVNLDIAGELNELDNEIRRISLSYKYAYTGNELFLVDYLRFDDIKMINELLITFKKGTVNIFELDMENVQFVGSININKKIFDEIIKFDNSCDMFILENGDKLTLTGNLYEQNYINYYIHNPLFQLRQLYFMFREGCLICAHNSDKYEIIIKPLMQFLSIIKINTVKINNNNIYLTTIILQKNIDLEIIGNDDKQIIFYDGNIFLTDEILYEITLTDESIYYDNINICYDEKIGNNIIIDINVSQPVVNHLIKIIPYIYRLNNEMIYGFDQIDSESNIISYGDGVTRHIFNMLRKEIDDILENKFASFSLEDTFNLGKLFYFCNREGMETFFKIHPYFFFLLSNETDYITLLKKFKGDNFNMYYSQYTQYVNNPKLLEDLDLDIKTPNEYIKYLLCSDLSEEQKKYYETFYKGFNNFIVRNKLYNLIKKLPVLYYIKLLVGTGFFDVQLEYFTKNENVDKKYFEDFKKIFGELFAELTRTEMSFFVQNITGSQYYSGVINIVLAYESKELNTQQAIYNENIIDEEPLAINDIIINLDQNNDENKLVYQIITCNTELIINVKPTRENISEIIKMLIIEDKNMKN